MNGAIQSFFAGSDWRSLRSNALPVPDEALFASPLTVSIESRVRLLRCVSRKLSLSRLRVSSMRLKLLES